MKTPFIRPVKLEDYERILSFAQRTGGGMTSLPPEPHLLRNRLNFCVDSWNKQATEPGGEIYMMVLERDGEIIGTSAVFSAVGLEHGFVNYRINKTVHVSKQLKKRIERRLLVPTHDFTGCGEVGSLFISPDVRGGGFGKFLAKARYLFIALHKDLIAEPVCAEIRGWRGKNGEQPFWDALGKPFFDMEFDDADVANSAMGNQFIADLMPRHPIYVALLPKEAQDILGETHEGATPAYNMLLEEGFSYRGYIDVFDGGPLVDAPFSNIKTLRESKTYQVIDIIAQVDDAPVMLIAAGRLGAFRVARSAAASSADELVIDAATAQILNVKKGDSVRAVAW